jgi:uncharacterized protein (DUF58 family)|uniref:DUF58 domain-containing protein n=1 Tax=candidate division WOR-3 bacterium TaxID=2052148 RepID=A0A7C6EDJ4_UNCW3
MEAYRRFLLPEVIAKLRRIDLKARLVVEGFLTGLHRSPFKGFSVEFAEYRQYMPGDELKRIDWKVYAKTDRFYIREYQEETNLRAYLLLDTSGSMSYASDKISKLEYASYLAASLAYLLLKQKDSVGLVPFDTKIKKYIPPRQSGAHLSVLLATLDKIQPGGETDLAQTFHQLAEKIYRRGLVIILSDLFDAKEKVLKALRHFRHRKHEVLVFQILDRNEIDFAFSAPLVLKDLETAKELTIDPRPIRKEYQKTFEDFFNDFRRRCRESRIDYHLITTDMPFDRALFAYLAKRTRLG